MEKYKLNQKEIKKLKEKLTKETPELIISQASLLKSEYKKHVSTALITAFGLVIALVWKDVVTAIIPKIATPKFLTNYPVFASIYSAIIITIIAVIGILLISNWFKPKEK